MMFVKFIQLLYWEREWEGGKTVTNTHTLSCMLVLRSIILHAVKYFVFRILCNNNKTQRKNCMLVQSVVQTDVRIDRRLINRCIVRSQLYSPCSEHLALSIIRWSVSDTSSDILLLLLWGRGRHMTMQITIAFKENIAYHSKCAIWIHGHRFFLSSQFAQCDCCCARYLIIRWNFIVKETF